MSFRAKAAVAKNPGSFHTYPLTEREAGRDPGFFAASALNDTEKEPDEQNGAAILRLVLDAGVTPAAAQAIIL